MRQLTGKPKQPKTQVKQLQAYSLPTAPKTSEHQPQATQQGHVEWSSPQAAAHLKPKLLLLPGVSQRRVLCFAGGSELASSL